MSFGSPEKSKLEAVKEPTGDSLDKEIETLSSRLKIMQKSQKPDADFIKFLTDKMNTLQQTRDGQMGDLDFTTPVEKPTLVPKAPASSRFDVADMDAADSRTAKARVAEDRSARRLQA